MPTLRAFICELNISSHLSNIMDQLNLALSCSSTLAGEIITGLMEKSMQRSLPVWERVRWIGCWNMHRIFLDLELTACLQSAEITNRERVFCEFSCSQFFVYIKPASNCSAYFLTKSNKFRPFIETHRILAETVGKLLCFVGRKSRI